MLYRISRASKEICNHLGVSHASVLARASLPADYLDCENQGVDASTCYSLWRALEAEFKDPEMPLMLGQDRGKHSSSVSVVAFACSTDISSGLERLALFRALSAPGSLDLKRTEQGLSIKLVAPDPSVEVPDGYFLYSLVYLVEMLRFYSQMHIVPLSISWPAYSNIDAKLESYFGLANSNTGA